MKKRKNLTQAEKDELFRLRSERGLSYTQIARKMGISVGSVTYHTLVHGIEKPGSCPFRNRIKPPETYTYMRNGKPVRGFTPEEDEILIKMSKAGAKYSEMGDRLGRRHNSVAARLATLARKEERQAFNG